MSIPFFTRFPVGQSSGGGGIHRQMQLAEAFSSLDFRFISALERKSSFLVLLAMIPIVQWAVLRSDFRFWNAHLRSYATRLRLFARSKAHEVSPSAQLVIVDDPLFLAPLVTRAQDLGTPVVACCQNLESLSYRGQTSATPGRAFDREIAILSRCALVITISEWENEILQRHGVASFFFPYHPARHIEQRLKSIRSRRHHAFKGGLFTLGSVTNPGTRDGMITLIRTWGEKSRELKGQKLIVCGYGTEELRSTTSSPSVEVHGTVSDAELDDIITHSHGALSYQEYGGGSLTRVTELLTAGVPVVANPHAARDHRNSPGIISVRGISEVPEGVARAMRFGEFPPPTPPDLTSLRSMLDELACRPRPEEGASG